MSDTSSQENLPSASLEKKEKRQEEEDAKRTSSEYMEQHEALKAWDEARRAREINERAVIDVMFANMEEKIENGKIACNDLLKYVKEVARCQHEFVKSFGKLSNSLNEQLHYGSLENAVVFLKMHNINSCGVYEEHNKILNENIAVQLSQLVGDYSKQGAKILEAVKKVGKDYDQSRETANSNFARYLAAFDEHLASEKSGIIPTHDPWMAERVYQQSLENLKVEQDKYTAELEQIFEKFLILEERRIEATKDVLRVHVSKQKFILGKLLDGMNGLGTAADNIDTTADRQLLIKQNFSRTAIAQTHQQKLHQQIQQLKLQQQQGQTKPQHAATLAALTQQYRELQTHLQQSRAIQRASTQPALDSPSSAHPQISQQHPPSGSLERSRSLITSSTGIDRSTTAAAAPMNFGFRSSMEISEPAPAVMEPAKTGFLFRKSKIMKSWKQTHCVLTNSGFLYIFSNKEKFNPKYSVPLKDVSVHPIVKEGEGEDPNVFELVVNQGSFFKSDKYLLKAESKESLSDWVDTIKTYSGAKK